jgi:hypothetical protein
MSEIALARSTNEAPCTSELVTETAKVAQTPEEDKYPEIVRPEAKQEISNIEDEIQMLDQIVV